MPLRAMPRVGAPVTVVYLDARVSGIVHEVLEGGRRLIVATADGEQIEFRLRPATATFTADQRSGGARLVFVEA